MILDQLQRVRKVRNLTIQEVSLRTCIPADCIEAIERGEWDYISSPSKMKNYIRIYARFLNINPEPIVRQFEKARLNQSISTKLHKENSISRRVEHRTSPKRSNSELMSKQRNIDSLMYIKDSGYMEDRKNLHNSNLNLNNSNTIDTSIRKRTENLNEEVKSNTIPNQKENHQPIQPIVDTKISENEDSQEKESTSIQEYSGENRLSRRTMKKKGRPSNFWFYTGIGVAGVAVIIGTVLFLNGMQLTADDVASSSTESSVSSSSYKSDLRPEIKLIETIEKNNEADIYEISNVKEIVVTLEGKGKVNVKTGGNDAPISSLVEGKIEEFHDDQYITVYLGSPQDVHLTVNGFVIDTSNYKNTASFRFQVANVDNNEDSENTSNDE